MPLTNFGSILNFAEDLEKLNHGFYETAALNPECADYEDTFIELGAATAKNIKIVQRSRRENVTEMILEPIRDFVRTPFMDECDGADTMSSTESLKTAQRLEEKAFNYYTAASGKIKALPEVARVCKTLAKKHKAYLAKLENL
jgi:hypothetical protein